MPFHPIAKSMRPSACSFFQMRWAELLPNSPICRPTQSLRLSKWLFLLVTRHLQA